MVIFKRPLAILALGLTATALAELRAKRRLSNQRGTRGGNS